MTDVYRFSKEEIEVLQKAYDMLRPKAIGSKAYAELDMLLNEETFREPTERKVSIESSDDMEKLPGNLLYAFDWASTHEGHEYWDNIHNRLIEIRDTQKY